MLRARSLVRVVLALPLALAATSSAPAAQDVVPLVLVGDEVFGGATVTAIRSAHVEYFDNWAAVVTTEGPGGPSTAILRDGFVYKQLGSPMSFPAGATIGAFDSVSTDLFGNMLWNTRLQGTPGGADDDAAVYLHNHIWFQEGPADIPFSALQLPAGSRWLSFDDARMAPAGGHFLLRGRHDDPTLGGPSESFLVRGIAVGAPFVLGDVHRLVAAGQQAPGLGVRLEDVRLEPAAAAVSPDGRWGMWAADLRGPEDRDGVVYRYNGNADLHVVMARERQPSPVDGLPWGPLENVAVNVASSGQWTLRATVRDGAVELPVLVHHFQELARAGAPAPGLAPAVYAHFGRGAARLDDLGHVVWYARVQEGGVGRDVLYVDGEPVVEAGVTRLGGRTVIAISSAGDSLSLGPSNGLLAFVATLEGGVEGLFLMDLDG